jgi:hypothetical protein
VGGFGGGGFEQVLKLRRVNEDLVEANDLLMRASARLREENEHLRTIGKLCLAGGGLDALAPAAGAATGGGGGGRRRGRGGAKEGQGAALERMALDRRLAAEEAMARKRLEAAQRLVRRPAGESR